jgi:membrane dipeptidase
VKLSLFDTHCDTAYELYHRGVHLDANEGCHISLDKASCYETYAQYYAVWSNRRLDDEACWQDFLKIAANFKAELARIPDRAVQVTSAAELEAAVQSGKHAAILAVEDARLTAGKLERLEEMKDLGVKYLTLLWGGDTCIGGSHNTENGLTEYGKALARRSFELGIIPDVSHASRKIISEVFEASAEKKIPFIATHSNSYSVRCHRRNLFDEDFLKIKAASGVVGISLAPEHLCEGEANICDVIKHIEHYLSLGGEDVVCLGCDFDGIDSTPNELSDVSKIYLLRNELLRLGYSDELTDKIFYKNANNFISKYIKE